jgi:hypothetical protein
MNDSERIVALTLEWTDEAKYWKGEFFEGLPDEDDPDAHDPLHTVTTVNFNDLSDQARRWLLGEDVFNDWGLEDDS